MGFNQVMMAQSEFTDRHSVQTRHKESFSNAFICWNTARETDHNIVRQLSCRYKVQKQHDQHQSQVKA